jgi:hypothetical protein
MAIASISSFLKLEKSRACFAQPSEEDSDPASPMPATPVRLPLCGY